MQAETNYALHIVSTYEEVTERTEKIITDFGRELQEYGYAINTYENLVRKTVTPGPDFKSSQSYKKIWLYIVNSPAGEKSILARFSGGKRDDAIILVGEGIEINNPPTGIPVTYWDENNPKAIAKATDQLIGGFGIAPAKTETEHLKLQCFVIPKALNIRSGPNSTAAISGTLKRGDLVNVIEITNTDWYTIITPIYGFVFQKYLKPVSQIQELLKKTVAPNMLVDGVFGPSTAAALKLFQKNNKLEITGEVDEETWKQLEEAARETDLPPAETVFEPDESGKEEPQQTSTNTAETKGQGTFFTKSRFSIRDGSEPVLGVKEIAKEVADLIRNLKTKEYGRMVGIFGNWGRGKTFMVEQVWKALEAEKENPFIRVNFHAWKYQDTHASWAYLYEAFAKKYFSKPKGGNFIAHFFSDFRRRFNLNLLRHGFWPLVRIGVSVGAVFFFAWLAMHKTQTGQLEKAFWYLLTTAGIADSVRLLRKFFREHKIKEKATEVFKVYFEKPSFKDLLGVQSEIQNELRSLLKCWIKEKNGEPEKQILLFVDDIDRCSEDRIVQIIDALRVMLEDEEISKRVVVVAAIDERVLRRAIKWKYKELLDADRDLNADEKGNNEKWLRTTLHITSEYMDKLFLAGIKLGTLTANEREEIYRQFSNGRVEVKNKAIIEKNDAKPTITEPEKQNPKVSQPVYQKAEKPQENETLNIILGLGSSPAPPVETPTSTTQKTQDTSFELSSDEDRFLNNLVRNLHDVTPRQIRIFYYRYVLARNLLTVGLTTGKQQDAFDARQRNELLGQLLAHYTTLRSNEQLLRDRIICNAPSAANLDNLSVKDIVTGHADALVSEILEALEMVIAY